MAELLGVEDEGGWHLFSSVSDRDSISQGDLIRFESEDELRRFGIVITADCDLEKKKHSRLVTLVPVVEVSVIARRCLALDVIDYFGEALSQHCRTKLEILERHDHPSFSGLLKARLRDGSMEDETLRYCASCVVHEVEDVDLDALKSVLLSAGLSTKKVADRFEKQLSTRGDLMLLPPPPPITGAPRVAWLRRIFQEQVNSIAVRSSQQVEGGGMRVARLRSPYKYRLTQQVAQVFSDIGLPDIELKSLANEISELMK